MENDRQGTQTILVENPDGTYSYTDCSSLSEFDPLVSISTDSKSFFGTSNVEDQVIVVVHEDMTGGHEAASCSGDESTDDELWVNKRTTAIRRKDAQARLKLIEAVRANIQLLRDRKVARCVVWTKISQDLRKAGVRLSRSENIWSKVFSQWRKMNQQYRCYLENIRDPNNTQVMRQPGYFSQLQAFLTETSSKSSNSRLFKKRNPKVPRISVATAMSQPTENTHTSPTVARGVLPVRIEGAHSSFSAADNGHSYSHEHERVLERIATSLEEIKDIKLQELKFAKVKEKREELERKRRYAAQANERMEMLNVFKELTSAIVSLCESRTEAK